jgi:hypothetical protein
MPRTTKVHDPYGVWLVVKCRRGGWALWRYSIRRLHWMGFPPEKGPYRTKRQAIAKAKARAAKLTAFFRAHREEERRLGEAFANGAGRSQVEQ